MIKELEQKKKEKKIEEDLKKDGSIKEDESPKLNQKETNNNKAKKTGVDTTKGNQSQNKSKGKGNIEKILNIKKNASNNSKQFSNTTKK